DDIKKIHIADLQTNYSNQGLDIVEMRAVWAAMPREFDLDSDGRKMQWAALFRDKLVEMCDKEESGKLTKKEERSPAW
ncbi:unnamed protein product, partial [Discosporangium mesarthrocarpum]